MQRRSFLKILTLPPLAALWPRAVQAQEAPYAGLSYTDSESTSALTLDTLKDNNIATGVEYQA
jgi:hypothetical protein